MFAYNDYKPFSPIPNSNHETLHSEKNNKSIPFCPDSARYKNLPQCDTILRRPHTFAPKEIKNDSRRSSQGAFEKNEKTQSEMKPSDFLFFAANSTFHGMSHIFTPGKFTFRRALWVLAFVLSFALFLNQAYDRYLYYGSRPHVTKLDECEVEKMIFPAVTICNMNSFRVREITTDDYYYAGEHILELFTSNYELRRNKYADKGTWPWVSSKIKPILQQRNDFSPNATDFNISEFYSRTGHALHDGMLKQCKYRGVKCDLKYWSTVFTRYGKCYTFNNGKNKSDLLKTPKGGVDNGLEILLDAEQDDYMPVWAESDEISVEAGFKVQIHSQGEPPFIHELGFGISPGFQTLVATQEQRITFLSSPFGTCESGGNKSLHSHYDNYSISACRITCETKYVVKECGCRMVHMPGNERFCSPPEYKECADVKLNNLLESNESKCSCETPCEVIRYNLEMSSLLLPSAQALAYVAYKYNKSRDYVKKNFAKLNIFFEALNYETIDQKRAYEIPGLLGDIGGQMGLFIGASILTVLELVDYLYELLKEKISGAFRKRKYQRRTMTPGNMTEMIAIQRPRNEPKENHSNGRSKTGIESEKKFHSSQRLFEEEEAFSRLPSESFDRLNVITARERCRQNVYSPVPVEFARDSTKVNEFYDINSVSRRGDVNYRISRPTIICDDYRQAGDFCQESTNLLPRDRKLWRNSAPINLSSNFVDVPLRETDIH